MSESEGDGDSSDGNDDAVIRKKARRSAGGGGGGGRESPVDTGLHLSMKEFYVDNMIDLAKRLAVFIARDDVCDAAEVEEALDSQTHELLQGFGEDPETSSVYRALLRGFRALSYDPARGKFSHQVSVSDAIEVLRSVLAGLGVELALPLRDPQATTASVAAGGKKQSGKKGALNAIGAASSPTQASATGAAAGKGKGKGRGGAKGKGKGKAGDTEESETGLRMGLIFRAAYKGRGKDTAAIDTEEVEADVGVERLVQRAYKGRGMGKELGMEKDQRVEKVQPSWLPGGRSPRGKAPTAQAEIVLDDDDDDDSSSEVVFPPATKAPSQPKPQQRNSAPGTAAKGKGKAQKGAAVILSDGSSSSDSFADRHKGKAKKSRN